MTRAEQEAAAIAAEVKAADRRAPRARAFATEIREFLTGPASFYIPALDAQRWEHEAGRLGVAGMFMFGAYVNEIGEAEEASLRAEFETLKVKAQSVGAGR